MNGQKMAIRKNLAQVIRAIRLPDRILPIWIDALSINQKDVIERSRQVPRMGEIYDNAVMVYSYLGEPTEDIDSVFDFINELFKHPMVRTNKEKEFHFPSAKAVAGDDQPAENAIKPNRLAQLCAGLYRLLTRQYFRRAWMLQVNGCQPKSGTVMLILACVGSCVCVESTGNGQWSPGDQI